MKRYIISLSVLLIIIGIIITWSHYNRYREFHEYHSIIARHATRTVASNIDDVIAQRERLTQLLIAQQGGAVKHLIHNPLSESAYQSLSKTVYQYFPDAFAFTITDAKGTPLFDDIESLVGPVCLQDLRSFMRTGIQRQRIHPSPHAYHFDVATPFEQNGKRHMFFVSFHTSLLAKILSASQAHDHRLYLAMPTGKDDYLLEATVNGGRDTEVRDSYLISHSELGRTLSRRPIANTRWIVFDSYTDNLYSSFIAGLVNDGIVYFGSFLTVLSILSLYLWRAEQRKRQAEKHKDEFLSVISHELRTPLTAIKGSLSLLNNLGDNNPERTRRLLGMAINNTSKLNMLVNDILDLQKMEAGKMQYHMEGIHLHEVLRDAINDIETFACEAGARIEIRLMNDDPVVCGDNQRLMQVMYNLISNAIKYGAEGDTIQITTEPSDDGRVRVTVIDHGEGIPDTFRQRIFEKFSQADASATRRFTGTGLGLSIVKAIIEEHNGSVGFDSRAGGGSRFYFDLPLLTAETVDNC